MGEVDILPVAILKIIVNIAGFYLAALFFPDITYDYPAALLWAGLVLGVVNILVKPVLVLLTLPIKILTFGLFTLVINTLMVSLTGFLINGLHIPGFWYAFAVAIFISILNMLFFK
ncbi:MAG TPA: phage holin family protein [Syntrophomonadaceae bacterium]|nr:phage holin family protein [Syntrophomonadaceae bacterium]